MKITLLGTGTSVGVPMIGCECATCTSTDPRDKRLRTGVFLEHNKKKYVIDISADFRQQAFRSNLTNFDALLITHCHADHVFGLDDIRPINFKHGAMPVYASESTWQQLRRVFFYIFEAKHIGGGLPQLIPNSIENFTEFALEDLQITPIPVIHGKGETTAFRFAAEGKSFAFVTDCNSIAEESLRALEGLDVLILDALRIKPHPTHLHLEQSLSYIERLKPRQAYLTHIGHDIKHADISPYLPDGVALAYDGLEINL